MIEIGQTTRYTRRRNENIECATLLSLDGRTRTAVNKRTKQTKKR